MHIVIEFIILAIGFAMLVKGADWFVDGAVSVAERFKIPEIVIGLTVVAMGTSLPEASVSIASALKGSAGITIGNVLGSNIMNVLLILGLTALISRIPVHSDTLRYDMPLVIMVTAGLAFMGLQDNEISRIEGAVLVFIMVVYIIHLIWRTQKQSDDDIDPEVATETLEEISEANEEKSDQGNESGEAKESSSMSVGKMVLLIIVGIAFITAGSNFTVDAATEIATVLGVDERIIGLTIVAFGTSLPELVTSIAAAVKGNTDIAIGNIVGSNIFNILFVAGITAVITPVVYKSSFLLDSCVAVGTVVLLLLCILPRKQLGKISGIIMLAGYAVYTAIILYS